MSESVSREEWLAGLEEIMSRHHDEGMSTNEIADALNLSVRSVRSMLGTASRSGRLICGFKNAHAIDGRITKIPVYRLKSGG